jgi:hypothetical protein
MAPSVDMFRFDVGEASCVVMLVASWRGLLAYPTGRWLAGWLSDRPATSNDGRRMTYLAQTNDANIRYLVPYTLITAA